MKWIALAFALTMTWAPVFGALTQILSVALTPATQEAGRAALRRCLAFAAAWTAAAVALAWTVEATWPLWPLGAVAFQTGWWIGARPLHRRNAAAIEAERTAAAAAAATDPSPPSRRAASLVSRDDDAPVPAAAWAVPVVLLVSAGAATGWGLAATGAEGTRVTIAAALWVGAFSFLACWGWWARAQRLASQDLGAGEDAARLEPLYRDFRRFLVRGIFAGAFLATLLFAGASVATAWIPEDMSGVGGWVGGVGGAVLGVWGGVFGALADRRRRAIIEAGGVPPEPGVRRRAAVRGQAADGATAS